MYWIYENNDNISSNIETLSKDKIKYLMASYGDISYITNSILYDIWNVF